MNVESCYIYSSSCHLLNLHVLAVANHLQSDTFQVCLSLRLHIKKYVQTS